jgi:hypothetical protein
MRQSLRPRRQAENTGGAAVKGVGSGLLGGLLARLPCFPPALALALGLGGSTAFAALVPYEPLFQLGGLALTVLVACWVLRRRVRAYRGDQSQFPVLLLAAGSYLVVYLAVAYVVTPFLYQVYAQR